MHDKGSNYFVGAVYSTNCSFSNFYNFIKKFSNEFKEIPYDKKQVGDRLQQVISKLEVNNRGIGQKEAESILYAKDLKDIKKNLDQLDLPPIKVMLNQHYKIMKDLIISYDLSHKFPNYFIVDNFPPPFDNMEWSAAFFEEPEEKLYNLKQGIYLKEKYVEPFASSSTLGHEIIHMLVGYNSEGKYREGICRGLEDGICDLFGGIYLTNKVLGNENSIVRNIITYSHFNYFKDQKFIDLYRENLMQAIIIYKYYGLDGLMDLIKNGREKIINAEKLALEGKYEKMNLKKGNWDKNLDDLVNLFISKPKNLVISPLAYYISQIPLEKRDIKDVINQLNLNQEESVNALKELQERVFLIILNEGKINGDASKIYLETNTLRYEN